MRLLLLAVPAALALACSLPGEDDYFGRVPKPDPDHFRWCNSGEPEFIDPALTTSTTGIPLVFTLWAGLADHDDDGYSVPSIATRWEISEDARTFTFHLRSDAVFSNGRPITSADFAYHIARILHPQTLSRVAEPLWKIKNGELFYKGRAKRLLRDAPPFEKGDIVEIIGEDGDVVEDLKKLDVPNPNARTADQDLQLYDHPDWPEAWKTLEEPYETLPAGTEMEIVDVGGEDDAWAYVFARTVREYGVYGWVEREHLTGQPNGDRVYTVREVPPEHIPGEDHPPAPEDWEPRQGTARGRDLLATSDLLGVRTPDPHTLVLETWGPVPYMTDMLADRHFRPSPREAVSRWPRRWSRPEHIITSGPLHLIKWKQRDRMVMEKSKTYWDQEVVQYERFTSFNMNDQSASANYYFTGGCDAVSKNNLPVSYIPLLRGSRRGGKKYEDFEVAPYIGIYFYLINTDKIDNVHFRRALNYGVDRRPIPEITKAGETPTAQYVPGTRISELSDEDLAACGVSRDHPGVAMVIEPGELCYVPAPGLDFDLKKAKEELAIAREEMGDDFPEKFTVRFNTGVEQHKLIAEYLQREWKTNLDLDVQLESQEWKTFLKTTTAGEYQVARMGWIMSFPEPESEILSVFKCDNPSNRANFCSDEYERLFKKLERTGDREERLAILRQANEHLVSQAPIIPLYVYVQKHLRKPYLRDLTINLASQPPLERAWIDPNWRERAEKSD